MSEETIIKGYKCCKCGNIYERAKTVDVYLTPQFFNFYCIYCLDKNNKEGKK